MPSPAVEEAAAEEDSIGAADWQRGPLRKTVVEYNRTASNVAPSIAPPHAPDPGRFELDRTVSNIPPPPGPPPGAPAPDLWDGGDSSGDDTYQATARYS